MKSKDVWSTLLALLLVTTAASAQTSPPRQAVRPPAGPSMRGDGPAPASKPASITRADPGLDALVASDARVELVASGFGLNEGTTWVREGGFLLVGGLLDNVLYKITPDGTVSVFMEKAGYTGDDPKASVRRLVRAAHMCC